jgi:hypothetical protein
MHQAQVGLLQHLARGLGLKLGADAGEDNGRIDRLGDVVDGAEFQPVPFAVGGIHRRDENHRDVAAGRTFA